MLFEKLFKDKNGKIVLWQSPNLPIVGWVILLVASYLTRNGFLKTGFVNLSSAFLFLWAYLEITKGVNLFRQLLGIVVFSVVMAGYFV